MCDGQVKEMQNILQSQEHNISVSTQDNLLVHFLLNVYIQINIVGEVSELLQTLAEHENPDIHVSIIVKAIQVK